MTIKEDFVLNLLKINVKSSCDLVRPKSSQLESGAYIVFQTHTIARKTLEITNMILVIYILTNTYKDALCTTKFKELFKYKCSIYAFDY